MINDIFEIILSGIEKSLLSFELLSYKISSLSWKRGGNIKYIVKKLQEGINQVEGWGTEQDFKFSVGKKIKLCSSNIRKSKIA